MEKPAYTAKSVLTRIFCIICSYLVCFDRDYDYMLAGMCFFQRHRRTCVCFGLEKPWLPP